MRKILWKLGRFISSPYRWIKSLIQKSNTFFNAEEEDTPLPDVIAKTTQDLDGVFYHINELRKRLFWCLAAMVVTTGFSLLFASQIIDLMSKPIGGIGKLQAIDVTESIGVFMKVSLLSGFALALPFIAFQLWIFVAPGLNRGPRLYGLIAIPAVFIFFVGGMAFAYYIMMPAALPFLMHFLGIATIPRPSNYINFVTNLLFWIGLTFEFPLVIYFLAIMGLVKASFLFKQWRYAIVVIAVVAAAVTPTVDPVNMSLVMAPMILLYFLSVGLAALAQHGRPS
jgi:sec-independent protein translocase protein TatC